MDDKLHSALSETDTGRNSEYSDCQTVNVCEIKLSLQLTQGPGFEPVNSVALCFSSIWLCLLQVPDLRIHSVEAAPDPPKFSLLKEEGAHGWLGFGFLPPVIP